MQWKSYFFEETDEWSAYYVVLRKHLWNCYQVVHTSCNYWSCARIQHRQKHWQFIRRHYIDHIPFEILMDDNIVKSIKLHDTQWHAQSVNCGTVCTNVTQHSYSLLFCFRKRGKVLISRQWLTAYLVQSSLKQQDLIWQKHWKFLSSYHFMFSWSKCIELGDAQWHVLLHMQLRHCYCFVVENMKLCIVNIWYSHEKNWPFRPQY